MKAIKRNPIENPNVSVNGGVTKVIVNVTIQLSVPHSDIAFTLMEIGNSSETTTPLKGPHVVANVPIKLQEVVTIVIPAYAVMMSPLLLLTTVNSSMNALRRHDPVIRSERLGNLSIMDSDTNENIKFTMPKKIGTI